MKNLYLIAAALVVVTNSEPQHTNNDIIWYPVDDEEGVFISILGEKHRTTEGSKWRSSRRARYSGAGLPLVIEHGSPENKDPSSFHNINDKRYFNPITEVPLAPQDQRFSFGQQGWRPQHEVSQNFPDSSFQEIINEVFSYKNPSATKFTITETNSRPGDDRNGWKNGDSRPHDSSGGAGDTSFLDDKRPGRRPATETSGSLTRPEVVEWVITQGSSAEEHKPGRPGFESDRLVFPGGTWETNAPSEELPTEPPTPSPCERTCPVTPEFNPVCGSNGVTYTNAGKLKCAQTCGKNVRLSHHGNCGRTPLVTPLVSKNLKRKFKGFY